MARTVLTYGSLNLNDGVNYFLLPGFDPGERVKTFDEYRGYGGAVAQANVSEAYLIAMAVPLIVQSTNAMGLRACIDAINDEIDGGAQTLTYGPDWATTDYDCVQSPRVGYPRDEVALAAYSAFVTFAPNRTPGGSNLFALRFPSLAGVAKVLYVGDSLTAGLYAVTEALSFRKLIDAHLATLGITDTTATWAVGGASGGADLAAVTAAAPDLCFIELGANDLGSSVPIATYRANMRAISAAARVHNPGCKMVYLTIWHVYANPDAYDAVICEVATEYQGAVIALADVCHYSENYLPAGVSTYSGSSDGWHPNNAGHHDISSIIQIGIGGGWPAGWQRSGQRTNLFTNPRLVEYGATGVPVEWQDQHDGHGTLVQDCIVDGNTFYHESAYTVHADDLTGGDHYAAHLIRYGTAGEVAAGDPATFALEYQFAVSNARAADPPYLQIANQSNTDAATQTMSVHAGWTAVEVATAFTAGASYALAWIRVPVKVATAVAGDTITFRWRHPTLTKTTAAVGFFYTRWLGATDASCSRSYLADYVAGAFTLSANVDSPTTRVESALVPVTAGCVYQCAGTFAITGRTGGTLTATVDWYGVAGTVLSSTTLATLASVVSTPVDTRLTAPAGATHALVRVAWSGATGLCAGTATGLSLRQI